MTRDVKDKLSIFLVQIINQHKLNRNEMILYEAKEEIDRGFKNDILKYYYFYKYYLDQNEETMTSLDILDQYFVESYTKKLSISFNSEKEGVTLRNLNPQKYEFLFNYGRMRPKILDELYNIYISEDKIKAIDFFHLSILFLHNNYPENWEERCSKLFFEKIFYSFDKYYCFLIAKRINFKLGKNIISEEIIKNEIFNKFDLRTEDYDKKSKSNLKLMLEDMKIPFETDKFFGTIKTSFFLKELNTIVDYDGFEYFFPLQTQLLNPIKFRYKFLKDIFNVKVVSIPYFEWLKYSTNQELQTLINKLIFSSYDIYDSYLYKTNFDTKQDIWKLKI